MPAGCRDRRRPETAPAPPTSRRRARAAPSRPLAAPARVGRPRRAGPGARLVADAARAGSGSPSRASSSSPASSCCAARSPVVRGRRRGGCSGCSCSSGSSTRPSSRRSTARSTRSPTGAISARPRTCSATRPVRTALLAVGRGGAARRRPARPARRWPSDGSGGSSTGTARARCAPSWPRPSSGSSAPRSGSARPGPARGVVERGWRWPRSEVTVGAGRSARPRRLRRADPRRPVPRHAAGATCSRPCGARTSSSSSSRATAGWPSTRALTSRAALAAGTSGLRAAGYSTRSAWLTSPTFGGISWLAHSSLQSGLWVNSQQRYDQLLDTARRPPRAHPGPRLLARRLAHRRRRPGQPPRLARGTGLLRLRRRLRRPHPGLCRPRLRLRPDARPVHPLGLRPPRARAPATGLARRSWPRSTS